MPGVSLLLHLQVQGRYQITSTTTENTKRQNPNLRKIARQLEAYAYVVLHASDLAADGDRVLLEGGDGGLELVRVDLHLLPELDTHGLGVSRDQGVPHVQPA